MITEVFDSAEKLHEAVLKYGFLPFFENEIKGFSIEEHTPADRWFTSLEGPWEWKGPVLRMGDVVYGKFFNNKAGYISLKWYPDFANFRRDGYDFDARNSGKRCGDQKLRAVGNDSLHGTGECIQNRGTLPVVHSIFVAYLLGYSAYCDDGNGIVGSTEVYQRY